METGTNVGRAYVKASIDGDGINEEIADSVEAAGDDVEKSGKRHGKRYGEGFQSEFFARMQKKFGPTLGEHLQKASDSHVRKAAGKVGDDAGKDMGESLITSLERELQAANAFVKRLGDKMGKALDGKTSVIKLNAMANGLKQAEKAAARLERQLRTALEMKSSGTGIGSDKIAQLRKELDEADELVKEFSVRVEQAFNNSKTPVMRFKKTTDGLAQAEKAAARLERQLRSTAEAEIALHRTAEKEAKKARSVIEKSTRASLKRTERDVESFGARLSHNLATIFGGGSRNNFLNLFGGVVGGISRVVLGLGTLVFKVFSGMIGVARGMFKAFQVGFSQAADGASTLQKAMAGLVEVGSASTASLIATIGTGGLNLAMGLAAVAAALAAIAVAGPIVVSVLGALLLVVVALSSAIVAGFAGALLVAGAAMAPLIATAGLLVAAFKSMSDEQKKALKADFEPVKEKFAELGTTIYEQFTVPMFKGKAATDVWATNLQRSLALVIPYAEQFGQAFARSGNILTSTFSGEGFQKLSVAMGSFLPSIITNLSTAFNRFLNGIAGVFAAVTPLVSQFALHLANVASEFSEWANSVEGQDTIKEWADRTVKSLLSVWDFAKSFFGYITDVLFNKDVQEGGSDMFDDMSKAIEKARKKLDEVDFKKLMKDAKAFGDDVAEAFGNIKSAVQKLYDDGVLTDVSNAFVAITAAIEDVSGAIKPLTKAFKVTFPAALNIMLGPLGTAASGFDSLATSIQWVIDKINALKRLPLGGVLARVVGIGDSVERLGNGPVASPREHGPSISSMPGSGVWAEDGLVAGRVFGAEFARGFAESALGITTTVTAAVAPAAAAALAPSGPVVPHANDALPRAPRISSPRRSSRGPNPFAQWARSLIDNGPGIRAQIMKAVRDMFKQIVDGIKEAARSADLSDVQDSLGGLSTSLADTGRDVVETAQNALNAAAERLANAKTPKEVRAALAQVRAAQKNLQIAQRQQQRLAKAQKIIDAQRVVNEQRVDALLNGQKRRDATLADYALARERLAVKIEDAQQALTDALALRDDFKNQIEASIKSFGSLVSAQAQTINGVQQALTAVDITANLRERLAEIKQFQSNLNILLAQGLSDEAYKQLLEAGVEQGGDFAQALVDGTAGTVEEVNDLLGQIGATGEQFASEASTYLYQAGVDLAQGLLDGLVALDEELAAEAAKLGDIIAAAIKKALGIASPSRVMIAAMDEVGAGAVIGLRNQTGRISAASSELAQYMVPSPQAAAFGYGVAQSAPVSGNAEGKFLWTGNIVTPTEDPHAVAVEVLNELTGRLP